jgi:trimeric autotransporter adhesin
MKNIVALLACSFILNAAYTQNGIYSYNGSMEISSKDFPFQNSQAKMPCHQENPADSGQWSRDFTIPGISGPVYVTGSDGDNLYLGGNFKTAGNILANGIVKWDGQEWSSIGEGPENGVTHRTPDDVPSVEAIAWANGNLYLGGLFQKAGTLEVNGIAYHDGESWHKLGNDSLNGVRRKMILGTDTLILGGFVYALFEHNNKLYVGGDFNIAGETVSNGVAVWDINTGEWESLNGGLASNEESSLVYAYSFAAKGDTIIVGGKFNSAGGVPAKNIAKWDGSQWHAIGDAEGYVFDLKFDSDGKSLCCRIF